MMDTLHWDLWLDDSRPAATNMAIDDLLLESMRGDGARPILRIYGWSEPSYSIGYFQPYASAPAGDHVTVRRPTGGGVVNHTNDLTFTLVFPNTSPLFQCDRFESYRQINNAVLVGFQSLGIECSLFNGDIPNDYDRSFLVCFQQPARFDVINECGKLCGGAQRRKLFGMLHQGSILLDQLSGHPRQALSEALVGAFRDCFNISFNPITGPEDLLKIAADLATSRYQNDGWNKKK